MFVFSIFDGGIVFIDNKIVFFINLLVGNKIVIYKVIFIVIFIKGVLFSYFIKVL